ncbi:MAG: hypothetical protein WBI41_09930 [Azovibrio sp.]|uniref:hypothetical protein n=1 Tax=Azovibrio sp. TaxID=1872673 RepID=UPI003C731563
MPQQAPNLKDALLDYVDNITTLRQKIREVREKQLAALKDLMILRHKCQALRQQLSRQTS